MSRSNRSEAGQQAGKWALRTLEAHLGAAWPKQAQTTDDPAANDIALAAWHTIAFARLLEFALRMHLLHSVSGMGSIRTELRRDVRGARRSHTLLQLEVAGLGQRLGYEPILEYKRSRQAAPADVVLRKTDERLSVETFVVRMDLNMQRAMSHDTTVTERLRDIQLRHHVTFDGDLQARLTSEGLEAWLSDLEGVADRVAAEGTPRVVDHPVGRLRVLPGLFTPETSFHGPLATTEGQPRLAALLRKKADQCGKTGAGWLRADIGDGLWQFTLWAGSSLPVKTASLAGWVRSVLVEADGLNGVVLSSGALWAQGEFLGESCRLDDETFGLRRLIEPARVRETIIIPVSMQGVEEAARLAQLYDGETEWLDWALREVGMGSLVDVMGHEPDS